MLSAQGCSGRHSTNRRGEEKKKKKKNCGAPLSEKDSFCQKCGAKTDRTPKKKKTGVVKWILITAGILLAIFAAAALFMEEDAGSSASEAEPAGSAGNQAYTELSDVYAEKVRGMDW